MTIKEFLKHLQKLAKPKSGWVSWVGVPNGYIRMSCRDQTVPFGDQTVTLRSFCPITAVCYSRGKGLFSDNQFNAAGRAIGLPECRIAMIASAADKAVGIEKGSSAIVILHKRLRSRILKAIDLCE